MRIAIASALWMAVAAFGVGAQPQEGDIVFGPGGSLFYADSELTTSSAWPNGGGRGATDVTTSRRNDQVVFPNGIGVWAVDEAGVTTTLSTIGQLGPIELTPAGYVALSGSRLVDAIRGTTIATFGDRKSVV